MRREESMVVLCMCSDKGRRGEARKGSSGIGLEQ